MIKADPKIHDDLRPWLIIAREWQSALLPLYSALLASGFANDRPETWSFVSLVYRVTTGLKALVALTYSGLEIQAFQVARTLAEDVNLLSLCWLRSEPEVAFRSANTPELSNAFWYKWVARGKLQSHLYAAISDRFPGQDWRELSAEFEAEEAIVFGSMSHPSYQTGLIHLFTSGDSIGMIPWWGNDVRDPPIRPFTYVHHAMSHLALAVRAAPEQLQHALLYSDLDRDLPELGRWVAKCGDWLGFLAILAGAICRSELFGGTERHDDLEANLAGLRSD